MDPTLATYLRYEQHKKSLAAALLLWFFLGFVGAHRVYLRSPLGAALCAAFGVFSALFMFGIWSIFAVPWVIFWIVEAFWVIRQVDKLNEETLQAIATPAGSASAVVPAPARLYGVALAVAATVAAAGAVGLWLYLRESTAATSQFVNTLF